MTTPTTITPPSAKIAAKYPPRVTLPMLAAHKANRRPIVMVTAYDAWQARLAETAGVDCILVGDSVAMTTMGYDSTLPATLDDMIRHARMVARGQEQIGFSSFMIDRNARRAFVVVDLPFGTYGASAEQGVTNGARLLQESGVQSVKLEGAGDVTLETVRRLVQIGVPVMGHLGMTPQSVNVLGGFRVQGKRDDEAEHILQEAKRLVDAGVWGMVLELVPAELAERITQTVPVPTIGIGAGAGCDGQVQVLHDLLGLTPGPTLKHTHRYTDLGTAVVEELAQYAQDVRENKFPPTND